MRTDTRPRLVLASASPARQRLLQAAGIDPTVMVSGVDESTVDASNAEALCAVLARMKAEAVAERLRHEAATPAGTLVLGCDSVLEFDGEIYGKPADAAEATKRWQRMRGRAGVLHTGHCLVAVDEAVRENATGTGTGTGTADATATADAEGANAGRPAEAVASTTVYFADMSDEEIAAYVDSGEPLRVAGAFTIDGLGGPFVTRIDGDAGTVIGLSLPLLRDLLGELGLRITDLWRPAPAGPTIKGPHVDQGLLRRMEKPVLDRRNPAT